MTTTEFLVFVAPNVVPELVKNRRSPAAAG